MITLTNVEACELIYALNEAQDNTLRAIDLETKERRCLFDGDLALFASAKGFIRNKLEEEKEKQKND